MLSHSDFVAMPDDVIDNAIISSSFYDGFSDFSEADKEKLRDIYRALIKEDYEEANDDRDIFLIKGVMYDDTMPIFLLLAWRLNLQILTDLLVIQVSHVLHRATRFFRDHSYIFYPEYPASLSSFDHLHANAIYQRTLELVRIRY